MFERFTDDARGVVVRAQEEAGRLGHGDIRPGHMLLGVFTSDIGARLLDRLGVRAEAVRAATAADHGLDARALAAMGIDLDAIRTRVEERFGPGALDRPRRRADCGGDLPFAPASKKALELALREATARGDRHIGAEHVLLGLSRVELPVPLTRGAVLAALDAERHAA